MTESKPDQSTLNLIKRVHEAAVALGLVAYAMVRVAYDSFYGTFGVTIEEVGLTYGAIVARAAQGFVLIGAILLGLITAAHSLSSRGFFRWLTPTLVRILWIPAVFLMVVAFFLMVSAAWWGAGLFFLGAAIGTCGALCAAAGLQNRSRRISAAVLAACFATVATMSFANFWGEWKADIVRDGKPVYVQGLLGVLEQNAPLVCVHWVAAVPLQSIDLGSPFISLGANGGTTVLYRITGDQQGALRLPISSVVLTHEPAASQRC